MNNIERRALGAAEEVRRISRKLSHLRTRLRRLIDRDQLTPERLFTIMSELDDAIAANTAATTTNTANVKALIAAKTPPAGTGEPTAAQLEALEANTSQIEANNEALAAAVAPPTGAALSFSPASVSLPGAAGGSAAVSVTGGNGSYSLVSPPAGVSWDGANVVVAAGTATQTATDLDFTDSATPPVTGALSLEIV